MSTRDILPPHFGEILDSCRDIAESRFLTDADLLWPCGHSVVHTYATRHFGDMVEGECTLPNFCPICRTVVTGYVSNHQLRKLVNTVLELSPHIAQELDEPLQPHVVGQEEIPDDDMILEDEQNIAYPGKAGKFELVDDLWDNIYGSPMITVRSTTRDCLIEGFEIYTRGLRQEQIVMHAVCSKKNKEEKETAVQEYFSNFGLTCNTYGHIFTTETHLSKKLFTVIARHNKLPAELWRKIITIFKDKRYYPSSAR